MATKSENFVIAFKNASDNSVKYAALDSRDSLTKNDNPASFKKYFTRDDAVALVKALKKKGLDEGITVRVKSLSQSFRDYSWTMIEATRAAERVDAETMEKVLKRYEVKDKPAKVETPEEPAAEKETPAPVEDLPQE